MLSTKHILRTYCCICLSRKRYLHQLNSTNEIYRLLLAKEKTVANLRLDTSRNPPVLSQCEEELTNNLRKSQCFMTENASYKSVCWECRAMLIKIKKFRRLVIEADDFINEISEKHELEKNDILETTTCKSSLALTVSYIHEYYPKSYCLDDANSTTEKTILVNKEEHLLIKNESRSEHSDIDTEYNFETAELLDLKTTERDAELGELQKKTQQKPHSDKINKKVERKANRCNKSNKTVKQSKIEPSKLSKEHKKTIFEIIQEVKQKDDKANKELKLKPEKTRKKVKAKTRKTEEFNANKTEKDYLTNVTQSAQTMPVPMFKRSVKGFGYSLRPIDKEKFKILKLDEEGIAKSRLEDAIDEKYLKFPYKCELCIVGFKNDELLADHNKLKHDVTAGEFPCDICSVRFCSVRVARAHRRRHARRYACAACGERARLMRDLWRHYAERHGQSVYTCALCGLALRSAGAYRYHREGHKERAECDYCGRSFQSRAGLFSHIVIHMKLPPVPCPVCQKSIRNKYALPKHLSRHAAARDQRHYCPPCQIYFSSKYSYAHHLRSSSKHVAPQHLRFACSDCDKRFYTEKRRTEHHNSVHLKRTEHQCSQCMKWFCNKSTLRIHVQGVHERVRAPRDKICHHCAKAFYCAGSLRAHVRTHTGERPFTCALCPAAFTQSSSLRTHTARLHPA